MSSGRLCGIDESARAPVSCDCLRVAALGVRDSFEPVASPGFRGSFEHDTAPGDRADPRS